MHSYECQCNPDILKKIQSIYMATAYYYHQYQDMCNNLLFNPPFLHVAAIVSAPIYADHDHSDINNQYTIYNIYIFRHLRSYDIVKFELVSLTI